VRADVERQTQNARAELDHLQRRRDGIVAQLAQLSEMATSLTGGGQASPPAEEAKAPAKRPAAAAKRPTAPAPAPDSTAAPKMTTPATER